jgi:hypothetical protein
MPSAPASRRFWENAAVRLAGRVNFSAWLDEFAPAAFGVGTLGAVALYALRRTRGSEIWAWLALAVGLLAATVAAWRLARRRFFSRTDARVLLEHHLRMDAALSAATAEIAAWPNPAPIPRVLRWHAPNTLWWLAGAAALLAASGWLPVPPADGSGARPTEKPPALSQTEAWLQAAEQIPAVDPASVETFAERARELAEKAPEQQYDHSSLEAADTLRAQTADAMQDLASNMEKAADALSPIENNKTALTDGQLGRLADNLSAALHGMKEGGLTANPELAKQLEGLGNASGLSQLSAAQAAQLGRQLGQGANSLNGVIGASGAGAKIAGKNGLPGGLGSGQFPGPGGQGPGRGFGPPGPGGGGDTAPLSFSDQQTKAEAGKMQTMGDSDLSRAALGDKIDTQRSAPDAVDPTKTAGPTAAGAIAAPASGGEAVWVDQLSPAERTALKDFFK